MKLYHATKKENQGLIEMCGLQPQTTTKISNEEDRILEDGIYGFVTLDDAQYFANDNCWCEYVVFEFDTEDYDVVDDPEYDGEAKFVLAYQNIDAEVVYEH